MPALPLSAAMCCPHNSIMAAPIPITFVITDLHLGGSPRMLRDLVLGLKRFGGGDQFDPSVVSLKELPGQQTGIAADMIAANIPVYSLHLHAMTQLPQVVPRLARLLGELRPRILFSILIHANALATLTIPFITPRPRFVQSIHTLQERPAWHWTLQGIISTYADAIVAPSRAILERIARHGPLPRSVVIPNGVDVDRFANAAPMGPDELPWRAGSPVIGYVGRFDPVKNLPLLLRSFALLRAKIDAELAMIGYGTEENRLKKLSNSLHIAPFVHFAGPTVTPERWYKSFACHCLPSTAEGFGLTLVEAIAAGIPVVVVRTAVTSEIVRDGVDGLLVDRPDSTLLAKALQAVITQTDKIPPALPSGPDYVRNHFSLPRMVELYAEFLKNF
jgi:glycosyltransferase involved in cell wall biosynthesis